MLNNEEARVFDLYFASIVSMAHCHPGTTREAGLNLPLDACAAKAYDMIEIRREYVQNHP